MSEMEKFVVEDVEVEIPGELVENFQLFKSVISKETWTNILSEDEKSYLCNFLPYFGENGEELRQETLESLLSGKNFAFGNPLKLFHNNLKDGSYNPEVSKLRKMCETLKEREHDLDMRHYYEKLLCSAVISKRNILERLYKFSARSANKLQDHMYFKDESHLQQKSIHYRLNQRCHKYIKEVKEEVGEDDSMSSDDDDDDDLYCREKMPYFSTLTPNDIDASVKFSTSDTNKSKSGNQMPLTDNSFKSMVKKYRKRKRCNANHPEFEVSGITLEDVMARAEYSKKPKLNPGNNKMKKAKQSVEGIAGDLPPQAAEQDDSSFGMVTEIKLESYTPIKTEPSPSFFSLIRDLICAEFGYGISINKLEEKISEWQKHNSMVALNAWSLEYSNWTELVVPALRFLSGEMEGFHLDDFDPLVCFKDQTCTWRSDSMSDDELSLLYYHWMEQRNSHELNNTMVDLSAPVPPPRLYTNYVVQASNAEEKDAFRIQELQRFLNPHKAFTYRLHGYESVVGPIKGIYSKESSAVKAREHAMLINERPACVNILTLVHDSSARLPNGEGTRSDICELLKDSQFLAPGVTDAQINTIVSGALDRLHYERDPCVKYDNSRKVWIYRHRHRTEAEFERIHQIQKTSLKVKKLACPKKGSLTKLQMSILKQQKEAGGRQHARNSSVQSSTSTKTSTSSVQSQPVLSSPHKIVKSSVVTLPASVPTATITATTLKQPHQHIHTVLQLPDGSIIKASPSVKQPSTPVRMMKISTVSTAANVERTYSLLANRTLPLKNSINIEQESLTKGTLPSAIGSTVPSIPSKTDVSQLRMISQIQQQLLQQPKQMQQPFPVRVPTNNFPSSTIIRPGIQSPTAVASLLNNQKIQISSLLTSRAGAVPSNIYSPHLLKGNTLVLPSSTSSHSVNGLQGLICVTIANNNLTQLNQGNLIRSQSNSGASNVRVLSLPTRVIVPEQQHSHKNILISNAVGQPVSQTLMGPSAIYLAANVQNKMIHDPAKSNVTIVKSVANMPRPVNPSISLLSPSDVRLAIVRPRAQQDQSAVPQMLQARLPTSIQGFFQIVNRTSLPTQTTTSSSG